MKEKVSAYKLLLILLCLSVVDVALAAINGTFAGNWIPWIERGRTVVVIVCLFLLGRDNWLYRCAAILMIPVFLINMAQALTWQPVLEFWWEHEDLYNILGRVIMVPQIVAMVFHWLGHGKTAPQLRKHWVIFLIAHFVVATGFALASSVVASQYIAQNISKEAMEAFYRVFGLSKTVTGVVYTYFLYRTAKIVKSKEAESRRISPENVDTL